MKKYLGIIGMTTLIALSACVREVQEEQVIGSESTPTTQTIDRNISSLSSSMSSSCGPTGCGLPLTAEQQYVLYSKGTEAPFTSPLNDEHRKGIFVAADTGEPLFRSEDKFNSGTGWPSFTQPISSDAVVLHEDTTLGMTRTEVTTKNGSHLGHVFDDGPNPTGKRYCINGLALRFVPDEASEKVKSSEVRK